MTALVAAACALLGLLVGSFLNVVVWRVPRGESVVSPGSHCPSCGTALGPLENVPVVSWLVLRARCRHCGEPISARYPAVELATAVLFGLLGVRFGAAAVLPAFLYLAAISVALALIDLDTRRLPNSIVLPSYVVGAVLLAAAALADGRPAPLLRAGIGAAALFAFYFAIAFAYPAGMGFGDVKLAGVLGLYLGWVGYGALVVGAFLGFLLGGVLGGALMVLGRAGRKTAIPFGPWMLAGAMLGVFVGEPLARLYTSATFGTG